MFTSLFTFTYNVLIKGQRLAESLSVHYSESFLVVYILLNLKGSFFDLVMSFQHLEKLSGNTSGWPHWGSSV